MEVIRKPYNETNIGRLPVPSDWEVVKLGDNASLKNGANFSTKDVGNGRLMVNVKDLYDFRPFVKTVDETRVEKIADSYNFKGWRLTLCPFFISKRGCRIFRIVQK